MSRKAKTDDPLVNNHRAQSTAGSPRAASRRSAAGGWDDDGTMSEFSVATETTGAMRTSTRRTEALYLEATLRQARKEQLYEMHAEQGARVPARCLDTSNHSQLLTLNRHVCCSSRGRIQYW